MNFNKFKYSLLGLSVFLLLAVSSCKIEDVPNPNGASYDEFLEGASLVQLNLLANGLQAAMRSDIEYYYWTTSMVGREYNDLRGVDPRFTGELLGEQGALLDDAGFLTTRVFSGRYQSVRNANLLLKAVENSDASLSEEEKNGFYGFANTIKAHDLLIVLNHQYQNGIRLEVAPETVEELGPFVTYAEGLEGIETLLELASTQLSNAGAEFSFDLSSGFAGFDTPGAMKKFNKGLAARVALYQGEKARALGELAQSFLDRTGNFDNGVSLNWSGAGNDRTNPLHYGGDLAYIATQDFVNDAEAGDTRLSSKTSVIDTVALAGLLGDHKVDIYKSTGSPLPIIKNVELVLIFCEAEIGFDNVGAQASIDNIRAEAGLAPAVYAGAVPTDAELMDQIIHERRYSLFGEGHRWVDMRRWGKLGDINVERAGDVVHEQFPRPASEGE